MTRRRDASIAALASGLLCCGGGGVALGQDDPAVIDPASALALGVIGESGVAVSFDLCPSTLVEPAPPELKGDRSALGPDTQLAVFDDAGVLIAVGDDGCPTNFATRFPLELAPGDYIGVVAPFDTLFADGFVAFPPDGSAAADVSGTLGSADVGPLALASGGRIVLSFSIGEGVEPCNIADIQGDGDNDLLDVTTFLLVFDADDCDDGLIPCNAADIDADGDNDVLDVLAFVQAFNPPECVEPDGG